MSEIDEVREFGGQRAVDALLEKEAESEAAAEREAEYRMKRGRKYE